MRGGSESQFDGDVILFVEKILTTEKATFMLIKIDTRINLYMSYILIYS